MTSLAADGKIPGNMISFERQMGRNGDAQDAFTEMERM